ncbi:MAG: methionine--tRNA ligase, partial [Thermoplasmata archaeon]
GKSIVIVSNLKPAVIRGVKSNGMLLAAEDENGVCSLLNPGDATPGSKVVIDGIPQEPVNVLEFDDFKKVNMIVDENQKATYKGRILYTEKGDVVSDRPVKKGAKIL